MATRLEDVVVSPNDKRDYRALTLERNGLRVMLVSATVWGWGRAAEPALWKPRAQAPNCLSLALVQPMASLSPKT